MPLLTGSSSRRHRPPSYRHHYRNLLLSLPRYLVRPLFHKESITVKKERELVNLPNCESLEISVSYSLVNFKIIKSLNQNIIMD